MIKIDPVFPGKNGNNFLSALFFFIFLTNLRKEKKNKREGLANTEILFPPIKNISSCIFRLANCENSVIIANYERKLFPFINGGSFSLAVGGRLREKFSSPSLEFVISKVLIAFYPLIPGFPIG